MTAAVKAGLEKLILPIADFRFDAIASGRAEEPLVLFLHGFPAFADCWSDLMLATAVQGFRTVAVDQRGYSPGARPQAVGDYAAEHLVADALGFAEYLSARTPIHLVGHDFGGFVAWLLAARHPRRLRSLTVLSTPHPAAFAEARATDPDQRAKSAYMGVFRRPDHYAEGELLRNDAAGLRSIYGGEVPGDVVNRNVQRLNVPGALTAALNWYRALEAGGTVPAVSVPTLYVWSTDDAALGPKAAHATQAHVSGAYRFEALENRSHWLPEVASDVIAPMLLQHLDRHR